MLQRARAVDLDGLSTAEACSQLQSVFEGKIDQECVAFLPGTTWTGVEATALSGPGAPKPITSQQNASSNCWPVEPKSHGLTPVKTITTTGTALVSSIAQNLFSITPILTVLFPSGNSSIVTQLEIQLTCMKAIELSVASKNNMVGSSGGNAAPKTLSASSSTTVLSAAIFVMLTQFV